MHGNVWELCKDRYGPYKPDPVRDPQGPRSGEYRIMRGGSWVNNPRYTRSAYRYRIDPTYPNCGAGVRLVLR